MYRVKDSYDRSMRAHGWGGQPPKDPDEARSRILAATRTRLSEVGSTSTSEVAGILGVTRQTVYRYYPSTEDLLNAAALESRGVRSEGDLQVAPVRAILLLEIQLGGVNLDADLHRGGLSGSFERHREHAHRHPADR